MKFLGHVDVARTNDNMVNVNFQLGMYEKALEMHEKDLEIKLFTVGPSTMHSFLYQQWQIQFRCRHDVLVHRQYPKAVSLQTSKRGVVKTKC